MLHGLPAKLAVAVQRLCCRRNSSPHRQQVSDHCSAGSACATQSVQSSKSP